MGAGAVVRSFQARIYSSATKDSPFIHVSTKCVIALTLVLVILSGKRSRLLDFFFFQILFRPRLFHSKSNSCSLTYDKCFFCHIILVNFRCIESHRFLLWFTISGEDFFESLQPSWSCDHLKKFSFIYCQGNCIWNLIGIGLTFSEKINVLWNVDGPAIQVTQVAKVTERPSP